MSTLISRWIRVLGVVSLTHDLRRTAAEQFDSFSGTRNPGIDVGALELARSIFATQGQDALFVLAQPDMAVGLPIGARILSFDSGECSPEVLRKNHYSGRVFGSIMIVMPCEMARAEKGPILVGMFDDYSAKDWVRTDFRNTAVFVQGGTPPWKGSHRMEVKRVSDDTDRHSGARPNT